ncbi:MAG: hypothetical protein B6227_06180 [Fusobacteriia bacterium 4572_74]|nr:MAG: hypothetical protein B6227_06180 [Fusobacteriia bacterium 4572_74]
MANSDKWDLNKDGRKISFGDEGNNQEISRGESSRQSYYSDNGVSMVHQELNQVLQRNVMDNI